MRWKKWLKRTIAAVLLSLLIRTLWLIGEREWHRAQGNREFAAAVAETEATDPDWRWEALQGARKRPLPERNSATVVQRVSDLSPPEWLARNGGKKWQPDTPSLPANRRFHTRLVTELRAILNQARPSVDLALTLKDYPDGHTPIELTPDVISTKLPHIDAVRHAEALLQWALVLALEDGNTERAVEAVTAMLNASRSIGDDPFMICQLVRMGTRVVASRALERLLAQAEMTEAKLATLQSAWANDAEEPLLLYGVRGERATLDVLIGNLAEGRRGAEGMKVAEADSNDWFSSYGWWLYRVRFLKDRAFCIRYMTWAVGIAHLPIQEQPEAMKNSPAPPSDDLKLAQLFLPAVEKCAAGFWRTTAEARCAVVGIACERFRLKNARWPNALTELCPAFLATVPLDPFDGQPLRYAKEDDGPVVYSVGRNPQTPAAHPGLPVGIDIGFRLWNPEARRQPAPPEPKVDPFAPINPDADKP